ncbi:unnamed protein product [Trifolium pratense]|uniref:Uncharacterized protein n=1 Tax=Trifolium pratense TaxID=57577 RepID=A0ACB0LQZ5_TRIPR|nr:unnamed protein product [Trifolium pratense]
MQLVMYLLLCFHSVISFLTMNFSCFFVCFEDLSILDSFVSFCGVTAVRDYELLCDLKVVVDIVKEML